MRIAVVLAAVLALAGCGGGAGSTSSSTRAVTTTTAPPAAGLVGIPQDGAVIGKPSAAITIVEFADVQCPYCGEFARAALPAVIDEWVRTGKAQLVWRGLAFLGPDSMTGLKAVDAAGLQNRLWNMVEGLYATQGTENSGWLTQQLLGATAASIPDLDVAKLLADRDSAAVQQLIATANADAKAAGVSGTPAFFAGRPPGNLHQLELQGLSAADFDAALRRALAQ